MSTWNRGKFAVEVGFLIWAQPIERGVPFTLTSEYGIRCGFAFSGCPAELWFGTKDADREQRDLEYNLMRRALDAETGPLFATPPETRRTP
jgi:hypothetical protein